MIDISPGYFSDTGYRFRRNTFFRDDEWHPFYEKTVEEFYDSTLYNSDTFRVSEDSNVIGELYFRLETEEVIHRRIVRQFID